MVCKSKGLRNFRIEIDAFYVSGSFKVLSARRKRLQGESWPGYFELLSPQPLTPVAIYICKHYVSFCPAISLSL